MKILRIMLVVEQKGSVTAPIITAISMAKHNQCRVDFVFNSAELFATPTSTINEVKQQYSNFLKTLH